LPPIRSAALSAEIARIGVTSASSHSIFFLFLMMLMETS
jgi:hypothetical protein